MYPTESAPHYGTFVRATEQAWRKALDDKNVELVAIREKPTGALSKIKLYADLLGRCCVSLFKQPVGTVLEVHYPVYFLPVLFLASLMKAKRFYIVLRFHGTDLDQIMQSSLFRWLFRRIQKRIDLCVAPSEYFRQKLSHELHFPIGQVIKVYPDSIGQEFVAVRNAPNINTEEAFTVGCVSRLEPNKNCQELLQAFAELTIPNKRLVMIGDGSQRHMLEALADQLGVREMVTFTGALPRTELPNEIVQFSVFVFPSVKESFGLVAIEALACGVPVIANAKLYAAKEYLEEARNGYFYHNGKDGLREAIETFYALPLAQRLALSEQAALAGWQFSYEQVFTKGVSLILGRQQSAIADDEQTRARR